MSDSVWPHRWRPTRLPRPWDSPGKNTGVGCHVLLQCMKVKSESEVAQSCPTLSDPMDCSLPGSSIHGILQARVLEWGAIAFSANHTRNTLRVKLSVHTALSRQTRQRRKITVSSVVGAREVGVWGKASLAWCKAKGMGTVTWEGPISC